MFHSFIAGIVVLPDPIKAALLLGILYLVRLVLSGRVPDEILTEVAGAITTALVTIINLALGLIQPSFEAIASAILNVIAILVGGVIVVNGYRLLKAAAFRAGFRF